MVRAALAGAPAVIHGGPRLRLGITPVQQRVPIYLAGIGPRSVALAGEVADGWLPVFFSPEHAAALRRLLEDGAATAGRTLDGFPICPAVMILVGEDCASARDAMRPLLARFIGASGLPYRRLVGSYGFAAEAARVHELMLAGKTAEAEKSLPEGLINHVCIAGTEPHALGRLRALQQAGVQTLIVAPMIATGSRVAR
jgi:alkanesulfonate monooxygenase SsuD/methylene tetrahydromethanopterin reductase-like flavin-dependent oxidoreductase (luciferase family)